MTKLGANNYFRKPSDLAEFMELGQLSARCSCLTRVRTGPTMFRTAPCRSYSSGAFRRLIPPTRRIFRQHFLGGILCADPHRHRQTDLPAKRKVT
jgi:hypothetical protein